MYRGVPMWCAVKGVVPACLSLPKQNAAEKVTPPKFFDLQNFFEEIETYFKQQKKQPTQSTTTYGTICFYTITVSAERKFYSEKVLPAINEFNASQTAQHFHALIQSLQEGCEQASHSGLKSIYQKALKSLIEVYSFDANVISQVNK